jgi:hypothetical protein
VNGARANIGLVAGTAAELLGGSVAGGGLGHAGLTTSRMLSSQPGLVGRTLTSAADTAGLGGIVLATKPKAASCHRQTLASLED